MVERAFQRLPPTKGQRVVGTTAGTIRDQPTAEIQHLGALEVPSIGVLTQLEVETSDPVYRMEGNLRSLTSMVETARLSKLVFPGQARAETSRMDKKTAGFLSRFAPSPYTRDQTSRGARVFARMVLDWSLQDGVV